jgi:hypothetical protein
MNPKLVNFQLPTAGQISVAVDIAFTSRGADLPDADAVLLDRARRGLLARLNPSKRVPQ